MGSVLTMFNQSVSLCAYRAITGPPSRPHGCWSRSTLASRGYSVWYVRYDARARSSAGTTFARDNDLDLTPSHHHFTPDTRGVRGVKDYLR